MSFALGTISEQYFILVDFYNRTGGHDWHRSDNWATLAPLDLWYGLKVNDKMQISSIMLANNNLVGSIPTSLCLLSALEIVVLSSNSLTGSIPNPIGNLSSLAHLELHSNFPVEKSHQRLLL
jgi:hypothetical protein